ncbi:hypothetical protein FRC11_013301 [Ceratobasidium sp. 423]|nr:hypothetical protein FRC11_013301 [Ceratobasidium sp. 423]
MALDPNAERGREVVSYVRVGRGMVKVTKYENEQPKSPSDTTSARPRAGGLDDRVQKDQASEPQAPTGTDLGPVLAFEACTLFAGQVGICAQIMMCRQLSTARGMLPHLRADGEDSNLTDCPPVPGSLRPEESFYDKESNYPKFTPCSSTERGRGLHISPPPSTSPGQAASHPSPSTLSWAESELDPAADAEMWSHITRLEDELVSRFGRSAVPQFSSLRNEKSSTPSTGGKRDQAPALPDELIAALQRDPPPALQPSEKLKQRSFEPINLAEPPRRVHRAKSSPTLAFPLPPAAIPDWVTNTPLPTPPAGLPYGFPPSPATMRAKAGPPPPFAPPPDFPPPPPPPRRTRSKVLDSTEDSEAIAALYRVLLDRANSRSGIGNLASHGTLRPEEAGKNRRNPGLDEPRPRDK